MKYLVIDIETTGTDSEANQILEIGIVYENTNRILPTDEIPKFKCIVKHDIYCGSAYAINMNMRIFKILAEYESIRDQDKKEEFRKLHNILTVDQLRAAILQWIHKADKTLFEKTINVAGKNYAVFDKLFLDKVPGWQDIRFDRRFLDPAILFLDWFEDENLPNLQQCMNLAGIKSEVTHNALEDAIDTLLCFRANYHVKRDYTI